MNGHNLTLVISVVLSCRQYIKPLLGQERAARRTNRVLPETTQPRIDRDDEPITTAPRRSRTRHNARPQPPSHASPEQAVVNEDAPHARTRGVVRQWVSELTEVANPNGRGDVRVPSEAEVHMLTSMFPDIGRDVILGTLQRRYGKTLLKVHNSVLTLPF